jgi:hypothetical protein
MLHAMTSNSFCTADATSEVTERLKKAVSESEACLDDSRLKRLRAAKERLDSLQERGLLAKQDYSAPSEGDFERRYTCGRAPDITKP